MTKQKSCRDNSQEFPSDSDLPSALPQVHSSQRSQVDSAEEPSPSLLVGRSSVDKRKCQCHGRGVCNLLFVNT